MSAMGRIFAVVPVLALTIVMVFIGCGPDRTGTALSNQPPQVFIVNTPPNGADFTRNPEISWYGTDSDGYITQFRYTVIREDHLYKIGNSYADTLHRVPVEEFASLLESGYEWQRIRLDTIAGCNGCITTDTLDIPPQWMVMDVTLDEPSASATINLHADVDHPVDSLVDQFFFIQAQDDAGVWSNVQYRRYSRNNHYPNTRHRSAVAYINAKDENAAAPGIELIWEGSDAEDWGRATPPLEYEWRLYGPFEVDDPIYVKLVPENCVWDPIAGSLINCIDIPVVDLDNLPQAVGNTPQPVAQSINFSSEDDTLGVWVDDSSTTIYDVFRHVNIDKTSQYKFVFWVRSRDDGFLPDPTPAFSVFLTLEAKFERDVAVFDATHYVVNSGRWFPDSLGSSKTIFYNYINNSLGDIRNTESIRFDTVSREFSGDTTTVDYFYVTRNTWNYGLTPDGTHGHSVFPSYPLLTDLLSHKVLLYYNDDSEGGPQDNPDNGLLGHVYVGMEMGASGWLMSRNVYDATWHMEAQNNIASTIFSRYFGIQSGMSEGWIHETLYPIIIDGCEDPVWNEQFIGGVSLIPDIFPDIDIDLDLLERYMTLYEDRFWYGACQAKPADTMYLKGLPDVGTATRTGNASAVYLYKSRFGASSPLNGNVMGVAQEDGDLRSAAFLFTPTATNPIQTQTMFDNGLAWLLEILDENYPPVAYKSGAEAGPSRSTPEQLAQRRQDIRNYMQTIERIAEEDNPEIIDQLGLRIPPFIAIQ